MTTIREIREALGQMLTIGFKGTKPTPFVKRFFESGGGGGVILFRRNLGSAVEIMELNRQLRAMSPRSIPYLMVDQEGGPVMRLREVATQVPAMGKVGAFPGVDEARQAGEILGKEVRALGFNVNCAPVLDVDSNPENPIIGERSFSSDPNRVGHLGEAFIRGIESQSVLSCGKHFPGHGDTTVDSHLDLPVLDHNQERLDRIELVPFKHVINNAPPALIMTAHILLPAFDGDHPATLSKHVIPTLLREQLGYRGVVITDDLEMKAVDDRYDMREVVRLGLEADVDVFLICHEEEKQELALDTLHKLLVDGDVSKERLQASLERIARSKQALKTNDSIFHHSREELRKTSSLDWASRIERGV